mgnify:CR=1 FL=1
MIRTQVYLTEMENKALKSIAVKTGKKQSELVREAIDRFIETCNEKKRIALLKKGRGLWKDRKNLIDFNKLRREGNRTY